MQKGILNTQYTVENNNILDINIQNIKLIVDAFIEDRFKKDRLEILEEMLCTFRLPYTIQADYHAKNVIVSIGDKTKPKYTIGAHYDIVSNSIGINDNTVAVATLLELARKLYNSNTPNHIEIVFFDREETGFYGSQLYAKENRHHKPKHALILDVIGFGDTLVLTNEHPSLGSVTYDIVGKGVMHLNQTLPSDNAILSRTMPSNLIVAAPRSDLIIGKHGGLVMGPNADFYKSFHGREFDDKLELINFNLVEKLARLLLDIYIKPIRTAIK